MLSALAYAQEIRDIRGPVEYPSSNVGLYISIIIFVIAIGALVFFLRRKFVVKEEVPQPTPWEYAIMQMTVLKEKDLLGEGKVDEHYERLSNIIRQYFEKRFHIRAPEMTTEEFLQSLQDSNALNDSQKETVKEFMSACDLVKFAQHAPGEQESQASFELALQLVEETKGESSGV